MKTWRHSLQCGITFAVHSWMQQPPSLTIVTPDGSRNFSEARSEHVPHTGTSNRCVNTRLANGGNWTVLVSRMTRYHIDYCITDRIRLLWIASPSSDSLVYLLTNYVIPCPSSCVMLLASSLSDSLVHLFLNYLVLCDSLSIVTCRDLWLVLP